MYSTRAVISCCVLACVAACCAAGDLAAMSREVPYEIPFELDSTEPDRSTVARTAAGLGVFPHQVQLTNVRDRQSLVAQLVHSDGITTDVTSQIEIKIADPQIVSVDAARVVHPLADGETVVTARMGQFEVEIPVVVSGSSTDPSISFKNDVMPVLSKSGCNAGSCHGAARGQDGFRLSLYGFDPEGDHKRLTRELPGRRIDLAVPEECLLIAKATGEVAHTGGKLFEAGSESYQTLMRWLNEGAVLDRKPPPTVTAIELYPEGGLLNGEDAEQQLTVLARYSDGTDGDVTALTYFGSNNDNSASVHQSGMVKAHKRGEAFITARFDTHTVGVPFVVVPKDAAFSWVEQSEANYIDQLINQKLRKLQVLPSGICTDAEFIRRVSIDVCGLVPTPEEVIEFRADSDPQKRARLVDDLLARKEFVDIWVMKWSELLQIRSLVNRVSYKAALLYYAWLQEKIASETPIDEMICELLGSEGGTFTSPATNYYENERDQLKVAENVAQVFMGIRIQCAQCHNHPFDRWTMDDYYSFAAFFSQLSRKPGEDPRETIVFDRGRGETKHPVTGKNLPPKFLGGEAPDTQRKDRRVVLADWLVSEQNPFFATNLSNIIWSHFFGRGIVHEVDDVRISNPATNQPLLDELGARLTSYQYDFKQLIRDICNSRTYQRSTATNSTNEQELTNFSHASLRRIRAEVLLDVISQITETKNKFRGLPLGARAVQIADGNTSNYFLSTFGRAKRATVCSCEVKAEPNLSQALHFLNGDTINRKIKQGKLVQRWLQAGKSTEEIIGEIYLRCLSREPSAEEIESLAADVAQQESPLAALEDVFWAVLNSREFVFNH